MIAINIRCPKCSKDRMLTFDEDQIQFKANGLCSLNIDENFTCEHAYLTYIDQHYNIRDYFDYDYDVELPKIIPMEEPDKTAEDSEIIYEK